MAGRCNPRATLPRTACLPGHAARKWQTPEKGYSVAGEGPAHAGIADLVSRTANTDPFAATPHGVCGA